MNIDGIILTEKAREALLRMQDEDNCLLKSNIKDLTLLAKKISIEESMNEGREKEAISEIAYLFSLCDFLQSLFAYEE
jgi:hypothetical protein